MKKTISLFLSTVMLISTIFCCRLSVFAQTVEKTAIVDGLMYNIVYDYNTGSKKVENQKASLASFDYEIYKNTLEPENTNQLTLPEKISYSDDVCNNVTFPVVEYLDGALGNNSEISKITVTFSKDVIICDNLFEGFTNLEDLEINCNVLTEKMLGSNKAFSNLKVVTYSVDNGALTDCSATTIDLSITSEEFKIKNNAFADCTNLEELIVSAANAEENAFAGCKAKTLCVSLTDKDSNVTKKMFDNLDDLTRLTIKAKSVNTNAVIDCDFLCELSVEANNIDKAFCSDCSQLKTVNIAVDRNTFIDLIPIEDCKNLENIFTVIDDENLNYTRYYDQNGVLYFGESILCYPPAKTENVLELNRNTQSILPKAFANCTAIKEIIIPCQTLICENAFENTNINKITITKGLIVDEDNEIEITDCADYNLGNYYNIPWNNYKTIPEIVIDDGITSVGDYSFRLNKNLTSINLPDSIVEIGAYAFDSCSNLASVILPEGFKAVGENAFYSSGLKSITIPKSISSIDDYAFYNCSQLSDVYFSGTKSDWQSLVTSNIVKQGNSPLLDAAIHCTDGIINEKPVEATTQPTVKPAETEATTTTTTNQPTTQSVVSTTPVAEKLKATSIKKLKAGKKQFKITWKKISGVTGYQIQYSTSKNFTKKTTKTITVKGAKKTSTTVKKLKLKKKYYVRIRTYKGKNYSSWSKIKTVKIK